MYDGIDPLSPEVNLKAKSAISQALTDGVPYCVLTIKRKDEWVHEVRPYNGLALDREAVDNEEIFLEFFAGPRIDMDQLQALGIIW